MRRHLAGTLMVLSFAGCAPQQSSNDVQREQQNKLLDEGTKQTGMPAIVNFRERRLLKDVYELRDQDGLMTYTYTFSEMTGKYSFFCDSIGYGLPYATQYSAGETVQRYYLPVSGSAPYEYGHERLPQAEPNGLFVPGAAEGTWVICKDPSGKATKPVYIEPRVIVSPFKLP